MYNTFVQNNFMQLTLLQMDYSYLPEVYDKDPYSNKKFRFSLDQELTIDEFLSKKGITAFYKICVNELKTEKEYLDGLNQKNKNTIPFKYVPLKSVIHRYNRKGQLVYILTFDSYVVKIGISTDSMKGRMGSYNAGRREYRKTGTPSTTNFHVTEAIHTALRDGKKVEWYVYDAPDKVVDVDYFGTGEIRQEKANYVSTLEAGLIEDYVELAGHHPILSKNCGKTKKKTKKKKS